MLVSLDRLAAEKLQAALFRHEVAGLELPHVVVCVDRTTGATLCMGPYPDAMTALTVAETHAADDPTATYIAAELFPEPDGDEASS